MQILKTIQQHQKYLIYSWLEMVLGSLGLAQSPWVRNGSPQFLTGFKEKSHLTSTAFIYISYLFQEIGIL